MSRKAIRTSWKGLRYSQDIHPQPITITPWIAPKLERVDEAEAKWYGVELPKKRMPRYKQLWQEHLQTKDK